jgi:hypothetical protein
MLYCGSWVWGNISKSPVHGSTGKSSKESSETILELLNPYFTCQQKLAREASGGFAGSDAKDVARATRISSNFDEISTIRTGFSRQSK